MGVYGVPVPCWRWGWGDPECQGHSFRHGGGCWWMVRHVQGVHFLHGCGAGGGDPARPGRPFPHGAGAGGGDPACPGRPIPPRRAVLVVVIRRVRGVPSPAARWRWGGSGTAPPFPFRHGGGGGVLIRARPILPRLRPRVVIPSRPGRPLLPRRALGDGREGACPSMVV